MNRLLPRLCAIPLSLLLWVPGCSKQGEGDRCDFNRNGHQDCETGLVCAPAVSLIDDTTDRCCPPEGQAITVDSCLPSGNTGGTGGSGGSGGTGGGGTGGGAGSDGAAGSGGGAGSDGAAGSGGSGGTSGSDAGGDASNDGNSGSGGASSDSGGD